MPKLQIVPTQVFLFALLPYYHLAQFVHPMNMWEEVQKHADVVQLGAPHLGEWSERVLVWKALGGLMSPTQHCHVWVSQ